MKYGLTVNNVVRVRAVTMDGEICEFGSPGLDLRAVLIGSEGMFAIVTEVTVRLIPKPQVAQVVRRVSMMSKSEVRLWQRSLQAGSSRRDLKCSIAPQRKL